MSAGPATVGALELVPFLGERGRAFPVGHCATVGHRRVPAAGRPGVERPGPGLGLREHRRRRRGDCRGRAGPGRRGAERRPLLGRPRRRPGLPRRRHAVPPADLPAAGRHVAGHLDLPARGRRGGRALAARAAARPSTCGSSRCWRRPGCRTSRSTRVFRIPAARCCCCTRPAWPTRPRRCSRCSRCSSTGRWSGASSGTSRVRPRCRGERRADGAEPGGPSVRRGLRLDRCPGRGAGPAAAGHLAGAGHGALVLDLVRLGACAASCRTWRSRSRATSTSRPT